MVFFWIVCGYFRISRQFNTLFMPVPWAARIVNNLIIWKQETLFFCIRRMFFLLKTIHINTHIDIFQYTGKSISPNTDPSSASFGAIKSIAPLMGVTAIASGLHVEIYSSSFTRRMHTHTHTFTPGKNQFVPDRILLNSEHQESNHDWHTFALSQNIWFHVNHFYTINICVTATAGWPCSHVAY